MRPWQTGSSRAMTCLAVTAAITTGMASGVRRYVMPAAATSPAPSGGWAGFTSSTRRCLCHCASLFTPTVQRRGAASDSAMTVPSAGRGAAAKAAAPPLSILSWSVDTSRHRYRTCPRRLTREEQRAGVAELVVRAKADIVCLQDSDGAMAAVVAAGWNGEAPPVPYHLVARVRNGQCGELQVFVRSGAAWGAEVLPQYPFATVAVYEVDPTTAGTPVPAEVPAAGAAAPFPPSSLLARCGSRDGLGAAAPPRKRNGVSFTLTNLDLSYRGKSLAIHDAPLASAAVSKDGSPFTLSMEDGTPRATESVANRSKTSAAAVKVPKGQADQHRTVAVDFLTTVAQSDVIVGNCFFSRGESLPGYEDLFATTAAGQRQRPRHLGDDATEFSASDGLLTNELTTNTFLNHKLERETNHFYFRLPLPITPPCGWGEEAPIGKAFPLATKPPDGVAASSPFEPCAAVPQVSGRFQRCFFRRRPSATHRHQHFPFVKRFSRKQLHVVREFRRVKVEDPAEVKQILALQQRTVEAAELPSEPQPVYVQCAASDQYPILVLLS